MPNSIIGGTGNYVGAKGEVKIKKLDGHDHQITLTFELT
jgi:hypothetical protein